MTLVIYIILFIISFIANSYIYHKKLNFVNVVISLWFITSILSMFGFYGMYIPPKITYVYIAITLIAFQIFSFIFYKTKKNKKTIENAKKEKIDWKIMNIAIIICIIIMSYFAFIGLKIFITEGSFSNIRNAWLNREFVDNKIQMLLTIAVIPLGMAVGIYSVIDYVENKKVRLSLILYICFLAEIIIATGARGKLVFIAGIMIIAMLDKNKNNIKNLIKENKKLIIFLLLILLIIVGITLQRNLSGKGFFYNIYAYFTGSIHLFGEYLKSPDEYLLTQQNCLYGQVLISGFLYPITFILQLFGIHIKAGIYIINEVTQNFIPISDNTQINNNVTFLYSALRDFGVLGLIIYPAIISYFFITFYNKKEKENSIYSKSIYYYFLINAIFLLFDFNFSNPATIFTFMYIYILNKLNIKISRQIAIADKQYLRESINEKNNYKNNRN